MRRLVFALVALILTWLVARAVDWHVVATSIGHASLPMVLLLGAASLGATTIKGIRWWIFLRRSTSLTVGQVTRFTFAGLGLNSILLANAGEVVRVGLAARAANARVSTILGALASDKVVEMMGFFAMAMLAVAVQPMEVFSVAGVVVPSIAVMAAIIALIAIRTRPEAAEAPVVASGWRGQFQKSRRFVIHFANEARDRLRGMDAARAFAISLVSWPLQVVAYSAGAAAVGLHLPVAVTISAVVAVNLSNFIRATPGNVGVFQVVYALTVTRFGFPQDQAVAAAVLIQSVQLLVAVGAGIIAVPSVFTTLGERKGNLTELADS